MRQIAPEKDIGCARVPGHSTLGRAKIKVKEKGGGADLVSLSIDPRIPATAFHPGAPLLAAVCCTDAA